MTVVQITIVPKLYYSVRKAGQVIQGKKTRSASGAGGSAHFSDAITALLHPDTVTGNSPGGWHPSLFPYLALCPSAFI